MYRIAAGLTSVATAALTGFDGAVAATIAVVGSGLVLSGLDRTIPSRALTIRSGAADPAAPRTAA